MPQENPFDPGYWGEDDLRRFGFRKVGRSVRVAKNCTIIGLENISFGDHVRVDGFSTLTATGTGFIEIGSHVHIACYAALFGGDGIVMEDFSGLSQGGRIYSRNDDYTGETLTGPTIPSEYLGIVGGKVTLGRHVVVGAGSIVLPRVTIGEGACVGAMSLVKSNLAGWFVYAGCPARQIRERSRNLLDLEQRLLTSENPR